MPRKPTGRPRGRQPGWRQYPSDDRLCIEMARLILTREVPDAKAAARRLAPLADGTNTLDTSKAKRLERAYGQREDWFLFRAKAPSTERSRPRQNGPLSLTGYAEVQRMVERQQQSNEVLQRMAERQQQFERMVTESPLAQEMRRLEETQRMFDNMLKGPFA